MKDVLRGSRGIFGPAVQTVILHRLTYRQRPRAGGGPVLG
jgi:hypothetical protein